MELDVASAQRTSNQMRMMLARTAAAGCIQRQRTSQTLVAEKSCAMAVLRDDAGKSVSPSAASDPVTPTIMTTTTVAIAPNGARSRMSLRR